MNKKIITLVSVATLLALPLAAFALSTLIEPTARSFTVQGLINSLFSKIFWPIAIAFTIIMFILAGIGFFNAQGDPTKVADARNFVIWGVVGMVVMILAFSLPLFVANLLLL